MSSDSEIESESDEDYETNDEEEDSEPQDDSVDDEEMEFESENEEEDEQPSLLQKANVVDRESESEVELGHEYDSDDAVQDAFQEGKLKPGLNVVLEKSTKVYINNVPELKRKRAEMRLSLPWSETLDLVSEMAPLAPELALKLEETQQKRDLYIKNFNANKKHLVKMSPDADPVLNDFKRETAFHRQAQAAVLMGIPKLIASGILSKRPTDYFAQMSKSDEHMQKVRTSLMRKQAAAERSEKVKKQRQAKKVSREVQIASKLKKVNEKREMLEEVKKYRKGIRKDLDFLEDKKKVTQKKAGKKNTNRRSDQNRNFRDKKFGFGGKKSGMKRNTKESSAGFGDPKGKRGKPGVGGKHRGGNSGRGGKHGKGGKPQSRPGKSKRQAAKSRK